MTIRKTPPSGTPGLTRPDPFAPGLECAAAGLMECWHLDDMYGFRQWAVDIGHRLWLPVAWETRVDPFSIDLNTSDLISDALHLLTAPVSDPHRVDGLADHLARLGDNMNQPIQGLGHATDLARLLHVWWMVDDLDKAGTPNPTLRVERERLAAALDADLDGGVREKRRLARRLASLTLPWGKDA